MNTRGFYDGYSPQACAISVPPSGQMFPQDGIMSDNYPICGQQNRTSMNFQLGPQPYATNYWDIHLPAGITVNIMQDISAGTDRIVASNVKNGQSVQLASTSSSQIYNYYVATTQSNTKVPGATSAFMVKFTPNTSIKPIPPPPPPPQ